MIPVSRNNCYHIQNCGHNYCNWCLNLRHKLQISQICIIRLQQSLGKACNNLANSEAMVIKLLNSNETQKNVEGDGSVGPQDKTDMVRNELSTYLNYPTEENLNTLEKVIDEPLHGKKLQTIAKELLIHVNKLDAENRDLKENMTSAEDADQTRDTILTDFINTLDEYFNKEKRWCKNVITNREIRKFVNRQLDQVHKKKKIICKLQTSHEQNASGTVRRNSPSSVQQHIPKMDVNHSKVQTRADCKKMEKEVEYQSEIDSDKWEKLYNDSLSKIGYLEKTLLQKDVDIHDLQNEATALKNTKQEMQKSTKDLEQCTKTYKNKLKKCDSEKAVLEKQKLEEIMDLKVQHTKECAKLKDKHEKTISNHRNKIHALLTFKENILTLQKNLKVENQTKQKELANTVEIHTKNLSEIQIKEDILTRKIVTIEGILKKVKQYEHKITALKGGNVQAFLHMEEKLVRVLLELTMINSYGDTNIQTSLDTATLYVEKLRQMLVNK